MDSAAFGEERSRSAGSAALSSPRSDCSALLTKSFRGAFAPAGSAGMLSSCESSRGLDAAGNAPLSWSALRSALDAGELADFDGFSFAASNCIKFLNRQHYSEALVSAQRLVVLFDAYVHMAQRLAAKVTSMDNLDYMFTRVCMEMQTLTQDVRHSAIYRTVCAQGALRPQVDRSYSTAVSALHQLLTVLSSAGAGMLCDSDYENSVGEWSSDDDNDDDTTF
mmetsp:Transcript_4919/g.13235  ORF Transcript_4919/g.13235 Transcript_4919/m.13235 type:complete len:222 (-) Transcript_4919:62-727(-)